MSRNREHQIRCYVRYLKGVRRNNVEEVYNAIKYISKHPHPKFDPEVLKTILCILMNWDIFPVKLPTMLLVWKDEGSLSAQIDALVAYRGYETDTFATIARDWCHNKANKDLAMELATGETCKSYQGAGISLAAIWTPQPRTAGRFAQAD